MKTIIRTAILAGLLLCSAAIFSQAATDNQPQPMCEALAANSPCMPGMMMQRMDDLPCGRPGMMAGAPSPGPCMTERPIRARHHMMDRGHDMDQMDCGIMGMGQGRMGDTTGGCRTKWDACCSSTGPKPWS